VTTTMGRRVPGRVHSTTFGSFGGSMCRTYASGKRMRLRRFRSLRTQQRAYASAAPDGFPATCVAVLTDRTTECANWLVFHP
jgi:hypothetical protein